LGEEKKEKEQKKQLWKTDSSITMTVKKGDSWAPDETLKMHLQEGLIKKEEKKTQK
jgi:hypothetical protein